MRDVRPLRVSGDESSRHLCHRDVYGWRRSGGDGGPRGCQLRLHGGRDALLRRPRTDASAVLLHVGVQLGEALQHRAGTLRAGDGLRLLQAPGGGRPTRCSAPIRCTCPFARPQQPAQEHATALSPLRSRRRVTTHRPKVARARARAHARLLRHPTPTRPARGAPWGRRPPGTAGTVRPRRGSAGARATRPMPLRRKARQHEADRRLHRHLITPMPVGRGIAGPRGDGAPGA